MTIYALDDIDDAIDATRAFLWPFDLRRWTKLALVVFFLGATGASANPFQFASTPPTGGRGVTPGGPGALPEVGPEIVALALAVVAVAIAVGLLFLLVGSVMEFVFVESLRGEAVAIRRYWGERWRQGVRLFGFRVALGLLSLGAVAALLAVVLAPVLAGGGDPPIGALLLAIPVFFAIAIVVGLVHGFTTVFVVPVMIAENCGVLAGWRRFWPTMTGRWKQYLAYAVMGFVLTIAAGLIAGVVVLILGVVLLIPFVIVALFGVGVASTAPVVGWGLVAVVAAIYVLLMLVAFAFVNVPVQTFLRYYALLVLGDTDERFDLVAGRRRAIRE